MPLPETIPVRYTEEEAGYVTVRPLVRQTFRLDELLDMILSVAGKDAARVRQLLHSGTVVYHFYRYSWAGFDADETELAAALARFPDADPSRPFAASKCTNAVFDDAGANPRHLLDLDRESASKRRLFLRRKFLGEPAGNCRGRKSGVSEIFLQPPRGPLPPRSGRGKCCADRRRGESAGLRKTALRVARVAQRRVHSVRLPAVGK